MPEFYHAPRTVCAPHPVGSAVLTAWRVAPRTGGSKKMSTLFHRGRARLSAPNGAAECHAPPRSIEHKSLLEIDSMCPKQRQQFRTKVALPMVLRLSLDVSLDVGLRRLAD